MNTPQDPHQAFEFPGSSAPSPSPEHDLAHQQLDSKPPAEPPSASPRTVPWGWVGGLTAGMLFSAALLVAYLMGVQQGDSPSDSQLLRETLVRAAGSHGADTMAMATGLVDEQEGLFVLDFITGELQCFVLNPRGPNVFFAHYRTNVIAALGVEQGKQTKYALVTGVVDFLRGAAIARPAGSVVYVCDTNTGNIAAYGIPWNRTAAAAGRPQRGALVLLDVAKARNPDIIE